MPGKRKPTVLKKITGNPGKRPLPENEPEPLQVLAEPPRHLRAPAKKIWLFLAKRLYRVGLLTELDLFTLEEYCQYFVNWRKAMKDVDKRGHIVSGDKGVMVKNPSLTIAKSCSDQLRKLESSFGFSPQARASLVATQIPFDIDEDSEEIWSGLLT